ELESFLDLVLRVTGRAAAEEDLVTLLWERQLPNIAVVAVPQEGDVDGGGDEDPGSPCPMPWPAAGSARDGGAPPTGAAAGAGGRPERSDDFELMTREATPELAYAELERVAAAEMARLQAEYVEETALPVVARVLATLDDCIASETTPEDRLELGGL